MTVRRASAIRRLGSLHDGFIALGRLLDWRCPAIQVGFLGLEGARFDSVLINLELPMRPNMFSLARWLLLGGLACAGAGRVRGQTAAGVAPLFHVSSWPEYPRQGFTSVAVTGDVAAGISYAGVQLIDFSNLAQPKRIAGIDGPIWGSAVVVSGRYVFVFAVGLRVFDIEVPERPVQVAGLELNFGAGGAVLAGDYIFVTHSSTSEDSPAAFNVIDVAQPTAPRLVSSLKMPGLSRVLSIAGPLAMVSIEQAGVQFIDISDPKAPRLLGVYSGAGSIRGAESGAIQGEYAWISSPTDLGSDLVRVDLADPRNPKEGMVLSSKEPAGQVFASGHLLLVTSWRQPGSTSVRVFDISDPQQPLEVGRTQLEGCRGSTIAGNRLYAATDGGITMVDFSDPTQPRPVSEFVNGAAHAVAVRGPYAYLADGEAGLEVLDMSNPYRPRAVRRIATPGPARDVAIVGSHAWLANGIVVQALDLADPSAPKLKSEFTTKDAVSLAVAGDTTMVAADSWVGLHLFQAGEGGMPRLVSGVPIPQELMRVATGDGLACVAAGGNGWYVIDIADHLHPFEAGHYSGWVTDLAMRSRYAFVTEASTGTHIFDLTDPKAPRRVAGIAGGPGQFPWTLAVAGNRLYLDIVNKQVDVYDVSNPEQPGYIAFLRLYNEYVRQVQTVGDYVYFVPQKGGLVIYGPRSGLEARLVAEYRFDANGEDSTGRSWAASLGVSDLLAQNRLWPNPKPPVNRSPDSRLVAFVPDMTYSSFTVGVDFKPAPGAQATQPLVIGGQYRRWFHLGSTSGGFELRFNSGALRFLVPAPTVQPDRWQQVFCSVNTDDGRFLLFLDGKLVGNIALPSDFRFESVGQPGEQIDRHFTLTDWYSEENFQGAIDNLRVFSPALSEQEATEFALSHPIYDFVSYAPQVSEGDGKATLMLRRFGALEASSTLEFTITDLTAHAGTEYLGASGRLTFLPGEDTQPIEVSILNDDVPEGEKRFAVDVVRPSDGAPQASTIVRILDNDPGPGFAQAAPVVDENTGSARIRVSRGNDGDYPLSLDYSTRPISATPGDDYQTVAGTLTFAAGELEKEITIPLIDDALVEGDEELEIELSNVSGGILPGPISSATLTIRDNERPVPLMVDQSFRSGRVWEVGTGGLSIQQLLPQRDGKVILAGTFRTSPKGQVVDLARLNPDGSADAAFAPRLVSEAAGFPVSCAALQSDGKLIISGLFTGVNEVARPGLARLNEDGTLDTSFDPGSEIKKDATPGTVLAVSLQSDGKVLAGGYFNRVGNVPRPGLARFGVDGALDMGFVPALVNESTVMALAIQEDGQILAGIVLRTGEISKGIVRLNADGSLDGSFDAGSGLVNRVKNGYLTSIHPLPDGKILVGGPFTSIGGVPRFGIARLLPDGSVDPGFDAGSIAVDQEGTGWVPAIAEQPDSKIVIAGHPGWSAALARLNSDGTLDASFVVTPGIAPCPDCFSVTRALALQADGQLLVGGVFRTSPLTGGVLRLVTPALGAVEFAGTAVTATESDPAVHFVIRRLGESSRSVAVNYATRDRTAAAGQDYVETKGILTFAPLETSKTVSVPLLNDSAVESEELFLLELVNALPGVTLGNVRAAEAKIWDNDQGFEFVQPVVTVSEREPAVSLTVRRGTDPGGTLTVDYATTEGTAKPGQDYVSASGTLTFLPDELEKQIAITLLDDQIAEQEEAFRIALRNPGTGTSLGRQAVAVIMIEDGQARIRFASDKWGVPENAQRIELKVIRERNETEPVALEYATRAVTATEGEDYTAAAGTLTFGPGEVEKTVSVAIVDDRVAEPEEQFTMVLTNLTSKDFSIQTPQANISIIDDDPSIRLVGDRFVFPESAGVVGIGVVRTPAADVGVSVAYTTQDVSARAGEDYTPISGRITFAEGQTFQPLEIRLLQDSQAEPEETFRLILFEPSAGTPLIPPFEAHITITDDDLPASVFNFEAPNYIVTELDGNAAITVERSESSLGYVRVNVATDIGTATPGLDYMTVNTQVYFGPGQTRAAVNIPILEDALAEHDEAVILKLMDPGGDPGATAKLGDQAVALLSILNAGNAVEFASPAISLLETNRLADIVVRRRGETNLAFTVQYTTEDLSAVTGRDYLAQTGALHFAAGQPTNGFTVPVLDTFGAEGTRLVGLNLSNPSGGAVLGPQSTARLIIVDDEQPVCWDPSFVSVLTYDSSVSAMVVQPDGKIVLAGSLRTRTTDKFQPLLRLNPDGSMDPAWGGAGGDSPWSSVGALALDGENRLLLVGTHTSAPGIWDLFRLKADGTLDEAFRSALADRHLDSLSNASINVLPGGKILVMGEHLAGDFGAWPGIILLNADGSVDSTFDPGAGAVYLEPWGSRPIAGVGTAALQADGKIVIGGKFTSYNGVPRPGVARLNPDGTLDTSFDPGSGVRWILPWDPNRQAWVSALLIQEDGRIIIAGSFNRVGGIHRALAARLSPDGSLDESLNLGLGGDQVRTAIAELDGRFILGGNFGALAAAGVARFDSRGIQDGTLAVPLYDVTAVRLDTNGGLLVGGGFTTVNNVSQPHLARLFGGSIQRRSVAWSSPYVSVGENGSHPVLTIRRGGDSSEPLSVHVHPLQATASPGLDFDAAVQTVTLERGVNSAETVIPILDDGLVEGDETFYVELRDPTPGVMVALSSRARIDLGDDEISSMLDIGFFPRLSGAVTAAAFQSDGKVLVAGEFNWVDDAERNRFARLNADGTLDPGFDAGLGFTLDNGACCGRIEAIVVQPDGRILAGGAFSEFNGTRRSGLARLFPDGSLDAEFAPDFEAESVTALLLQADSRILVGGSTIFRLNPDGSRDSSFANGPALDGGITRMRVLSDGTILAGGWFTQFGDQPRWHAAWLRSDGTLDDRYAPGVLEVDRLLGFSGDGRALLVGTILNAQGEERARAVCLAPDGSTDDDFHAEESVDRFRLRNVQAAVFLPGSGLLVAGSSDPGPDGISRTLIIELNPDGSVKETSHPVRLTGGGWGWRGWPVAFLNLDPSSETVLAGGSFARVEDRYQAPLARLSLARYNTTKLSFAQAEFLASEMGSAQVAVLRSGDVSRDTSVKWTAQPGSAEIASWFEPLSGTITFPPLRKEEMLVVPIVNSQTAALPARILLTLSEPTGGAWIDGANASVLVLDSETPGTIDVTFDADLRVPPDWGSVSVSAIQPLPDGQLRLWGNFETVHGVLSAGFAQLNADGTLARLATGTEPPGQHLLTMSDGRTLDLIAERLVLKGPDGTVDPSFDVRFTPSGGVSAAAAQEDGKILIAGRITMVNGVAVPQIARLRSDGSLDPGFTPAGGPAHAQDGSGEIRTLTVQPDGRIIVGGFFTAFSDLPSNGLVRLNPDGSVDPAFSPTPLEPNETANNVSTVLVQPDGRILALGWLSLRRPGGRQEIVRLNTDGSVDTRFALSGTPTVLSMWGQYPGSLQCMAFSSEEALYVGGDFHRFGLVNRAGIFRVSLGRTPALVIETAGFSDTGAFALTFRGEPGQIYRVESSTDLEAWKLEAELGAENGPTRFIDGEAGKWERRFYRVRSR